MRFFNRTFYAQLYSPFPRLNEMLNSQSLSKSLPLVGEEGPQAGSVAGEVHYWRQSVCPGHGVWCLTLLQNKVTFVVSSQLPQGGHQALVDVGMLPGSARRENSGLSFEFHFPTWKDW